MAKKLSSFRVGRVRAFLRGRVWYLAYFEQGQRRQPRVGPDQQSARAMAAEINGQLEAGAPSALGFQAITFPALRDRWLDHHEHVRRSSLNTIGRYRSATEHLLDFVATVRPLKRVSDLHPIHVEEFIRYLRSRRVAPNGHKNSKKRVLRDSGVKFVLETCSSLMNFAQRQRHLPPYTENPFRMVEINRIPIEDAKPVVAFTNDEQVALLANCDEWQLPIFATLLFTGLRPGELVHLLLPNDLDLKEGCLRVRNKPKLGWQVKTRNERDIPLVPVLRRLLSRAVGDWQSGPVFQQRRAAIGHTSPLINCSLRELEAQVERRFTNASQNEPNESSRRLVRKVATKTVWRDLGSLKEDWVRKEFMALTSLMGLKEVTAPKTLRHTFATILQDGSVDPLIRNELMGHAPMAQTSGGGLGMTTIYTHTRPETKRRQLDQALSQLPAVKFLDQWLMARVEPDPSKSCELQGPCPHRTRVVSPVQFPF